MFNSVKSSSLHHLQKHRSTKYRCRVCMKWSATPNRLRNHMYTHLEKKILLWKMQQEITFQSNLNLHRNLHRHTRPYECFAKDCSKRYKWPQDLLCHIRIHLKVMIKCGSCNYTTYEKHLLQHKNVHSWIMKFTCRKYCGQAFKHAMQHYRHERKCTPMDD